MAVAADPPGHAALVEVAEALAGELELPLVRDPAQTGATVLLTVTAQRLELRVVGGSDPQLRGGRAIAPELTRIDVNSPPGARLNQPLFRAVGLKKGQSARPRVLDVTAGFGEDAWLLASKGCPVLAIERHVGIATLLRDALRRAAEYKPAVASRIYVLHDDSRELLRALVKRGRIALPAEQPWHSPDQPDELGEHDRETGESDFAEQRVYWTAPDVVYIDPMFPTGRRAMERKPMRALRQLVGSDIDSGELLAMALNVATKRVVVKRPRKAPALGGRAPSTSHGGRSLRYDVYLAQ
jgi:16S rRNA (guanine1516-N2)-methyltransferase